MTDARESTTSGHLDPLQRVTEQMTVHHTLDDVLSGITRGLVNHADAALAHLALHDAGGVRPVPPRCLR